MLGNITGVHTTPRRNHFGLGAARLLGLCLSAILFFCATPAQAQYATGGSGLHKSRIFWVDWGNNGDNVYAGKTITRGFNVDTPASPANRLDISCTLSNAATTRGTAGLYVYSSGDWQGDGLDNLYNIGGFQNGSGANPNTLSVGLRTNGGSTVEFDFSCTATFAGANFPLNGLVFADAEASGSTEYVSAKLTGGGTMRVIDAISQCGAAGSVNVLAGPPQEVQLTSASSCESNGTPSLRGGPALVGFVDGATSARVVAKGGGISAVAVGAVIELEYSEATPNSYGVATHVLDATWSGGVATNGVNYVNPANLATFAYTAPILGATVVPDIDANGPIGGSDVDALAKTTGPLGAGYANVPPPNGPGTNYTINTVKCIGPGFVAGWIDFNGNGVFDAGEKSNSVACPTGANTIALTWAVPSGTGYVAQQSSYLRLRTASTTAGVSLASGPILGGEAEDYYIGLPVTSLGGKVWLDADGSAAGTFSNINTGGETGSNAGGLNAILVDASGNVLQSVAVAADGTYAFTNLPANTTVSIRLSTSNGTVGQAAPATNLPTGWANTSPLSTATFSTGTASVNNKDFGLDRLPDSSNVSLPSQINPGGSTQLQAPTLAGSDPDDGVIGSNKSFKITSLPSNGTLYYNGVALNAGDVIGNYDPTKLTVDPNDNATTLSFQYAAVDAAGKPDPTPATASMTLQPPVPSIGAAKSVVSGPTLNANGTYTITYSVLVKNLGNVVLNNAQISDDLLVTFPAPATFSVSGIAGSDSNASFDGNGNKNLLIAGLTLPVGASRSVQFTVTVTPNGAFGTRSNQALASGTPPAGGSVTDLSDSGTNPDPNNNGNPSDPGENDSTPITLTAPAAPVASDDNGQTIPGQSIGIPVVANDTANGGLSLVSSSIDLDPSTPGQQSTFTVAGKGTFVLQPNGTVQFTPAPGFMTGSVSIPYTIKDALGQTSNAADITVLVSVPAAQSDVASTPYQTPINFNVSGNDTTVPGRSIVAASIDLDPSTAGPQTTFSVSGQGTFTANPDGTVDFVPVNGFVGTVSIPYTIQDSAGATSAPADIIVTVTPPPAPVAANNPSSTPYQTPTTLNITANDSANGGATLNNASVDLDPGTPGQQTSVATTQGTWTVDNAGNVTFAPANGFVGVATLPYTVQDNLGQASNTANIAITVIAPAAPVANNDASSTAYLTPKTINVTSNDNANGGATINNASVDLDPSTPGIDSSITTAQGVWTADNAGNVTFSSANGFTGVATLPYSIKDNLGQTSNSANINITVAAPAAPVATNDASSTPYLTPTTLNIASNDSANGGATINAASVDLDPSTPAQDSSITTAQGTWTVDNAGVVTFTPANGFTGVATLPYSIKDNLGQTSNSANINITVTAPAAPVANGDTDSTAYQTPKTINVIGNDSANGGATINAASVDLDPSTPAQDSSITTAQGVWTADNAGVVTFTPANGFTGVATLPYSIKDNLGQTSNSANINITVTAPAAPVATNDTSGASYQTPKTINVTSNDNANGGATINNASVDLDPSTPGIDSSITTPQGVWTTDGTGKVTFTPANGFTGVATLPYTVQDNLGQTSNIANITVTVASPNAPVATDDTGSTPYLTPTTLNIASNDNANGGATINNASVDLDPSTPGIDSSVTTAQGTWTADNTGNVTFSPANGFTGVATLPYSIKDNLGQTSNSANINITVTAPAAPVANDDNSNTPFQTSVVFAVLNNDNANGGTTLNNASLDLNPNTPGIDSSITIPGEGTFTYNPSTSKMMFTPAPGFAGVAHITYTIKDALGQPSNVANIGVVVAPPPAPTASDDTKTTTLNTPVATDVSSNDNTSSGTNLVPNSIDLDPNTPGQQNTISIPGKGTFALQPNGNVLFTPAPGFVGTATTQYTIQDNLGQTSNPADINVTVVGQPSANDDSASTAFNTAVTLPVPSNDTPASGASLVPSSIDLNPSTPGQDSSITIPGKGTFALQPNGNVLFTPAPGFSGTVSAPYTIQDNFGQTSNSATLSVTVTKAPAATDDVATTTAATPVGIAFAANDQANPGGSINPNSIDLDPSTPGLDSSITLPNQGTFALQPDGTLLFTPVAGFAGVVSAPYTVQDNQGTTTAPATIFVTVVAAPKTNPDTSTTNFNTPTTVNVITNDQPSNPATINPNSIDLDPSTPGLDSSVTVPGKGTFTSNPDGSITFTPVPGFVGPASVPYTVKDNFGQTSNPSTLTINVQPGAPVASNDYSNSDAGSPATLNPSSNDNGNGAALDPNSIDLDPSTPGQQSSLSVPGKGTFVLQPNGSVVFTPAPGFVGTVTAPYTIKDTNGKTSNSAQLVVNVNPLPSAKDDSASTAYNTPVALPVLANDTPNTGATMNPGSIDLDPSTPGQQNSITVAGKGTFKTNPDGTVTFTPVAGFAGTVSTPYNAQDSGGKTTNTAKITVTVRPPDAPVANDDTATAAYGSSITIKPGSNDTGIGLNAGGIDLDPSTPGQQSSIVIPGKGTFTLNTSTGEVTFTPINGFTGEVALPYTIQDQFGQTSNTATIRITVGQPKLVLVKTASKPNATIGDELGWTLNLSNQSFVPVNSVVFSDHMPAGLLYKPGSSKLQGEPIADPSITVVGGKQVLTWTFKQTLGANASLELVFASTVLPSAAETSTLVNTASASAKAGVGGVVAVSANQASAAVKINPGIFAPTTTIVGRVYVDNNNNNSFELGTDEPVAGARVYLSDGRYAITDTDGRYSITNIAPGSYAVRLDPITTPFAPKALPDDQGQPGTRSVRTNETPGGISTEDFPLQAPSSNVDKTRRTVVEVGAVKLEKSIKTGPNGYTIELKLTLSTTATNLRITDPLPNGATRGPVYLVGAGGQLTELDVDANGQIVLPNLGAGVYTVVYTVKSRLPSDLVFTDPSITYTP